MEKWEKDLECSSRLADEFFDTLKMSRENKRLKKSVMHSVAEQSVIYEEEVFTLYEDRPKAGEIKVTANSTLEAAAAYKDKKVAVLNFASFLKPGGGSLEKGTSETQEESLCRESTLYPCISDAKCVKHFYDMHKSCTDLYNADMVYTPNVTVFKASENGMPVLMPESDWFDVDVITMAAPNISNIRKTKARQDMEDELTCIFDVRFSRVMAAAIEGHAEVLILGAFGCGAFGNDPAVVATGAARALGRMHTAFDTIEFAIPCKGGKNNFRMFRLILDRYLNSQ